MLWALRKLWGWCCFLSSFLKPHGVPWPCLNHLVLSQCPGVPLGMSKGPRAGKLILKLYWAVCQLFLQTQASPALSALSRGPCLSHGRRRLPHSQPDTPCSIILWAAATEWWSVPMCPPRIQRAVDCSPHSLAWA